MKVNDKHSEDRPPEPPAMAPRKRCKIHATEWETGQCPLCPTDDRTSENDRWWQAFCAAYPAAHAISISIDELSDDDPVVTAAEDAAEYADAMIAEAKKRGRL